MKKKLTWTAAACLVLNLVLTIGFTGCKKSDATLTPGDMGSDKEIYDKARKKIKRDPEKARLLFKEIMHLYPDSIYARRAKIGIADSYYKQKDSASLVMAATEYQEFVNLYPNSPDAVYAKMQIALCYYRQRRKAGRDQSNNKEALKALESLVRQYPDTKESEDAKEKIKKLRLTLADHYFRIGKSNYRLRAYKGAVIRFKEVMDNYPDYPHREKLFYYTGMSYYKMRNLDDSVSYFQKIINSHPQSKFVDKSKKMIGKIADLKKKYQEMAKISAEKIKKAKEKKEDQSK